MLLADHILGELPYMRRPPRTWSLTAELTVDIIRDLGDVDHVNASAREITVGPESFVQCDITGPDGALLAVGSTRCVYVRATADDPEPDPTVGNFAHNSSNIHAVLGLSATSLEYGEQLSLATPADWVNGFGIMHGGVSACVNELAAAEVLRSRNADLNIGQVRTSYLRPVVVGAPYRAVARAYHVGKSSAVVEILGYAGEGDLCTVPTVTARRTPRLG